MHGWLRLVIPSVFVWYNRGNEISQMRVRYSLGGLYSQSYDVNLSSPHVHTHQACADLEFLTCYGTAVSQRYITPISPSTWTSYFILRRGFAKLLRLTLNLLCNFELVIFYFKKKGLSTPGLLSFLLVCFFNVYSCFAYMYVSVMHMCLIPTEDKRGHWVPST